MNVDYIPILLSLKVAFVSIIIVVITSVPIATFLAKYNFWGKNICDSLFTLPLVMPPSVIGFMLLYLFGKNGPLGRMLENVFHVQIVFTLTGAIIAAAVVSFPLMYQALKSSIESVDKTLENAARILGANELKVFFTITLPLSWNGFIAGFVMAFARALGEFGATLMIAGNIPGKTQTMPLAIYFDAYAGRTKQAEFLVLIMTLFSFMVIFGLNTWRKSNNFDKRRNYDDRSTN